LNTYLANSLAILEGGPKIDTPPDFVVRGASRNHATPRMRGKGHEVRGLRTVTLQCDFATLRNRNE